MSRFFIPPEQIHGERFVLSGSEARHAVRVLRKKAGDVIELFDGEDRSIQGRIESVTAEEICGVLMDQTVCSRRVPVEVTLYQALLKGPRWDWLIEKACEVGVHRVVPILTARTIVQPTKAEARERWTRIALAAAKQCGRGDVMEVLAPCPFGKAVEEWSKGCLALIPWEKEPSRTIRKACRDHGVSPVSLSIGPEGGWDTSEVEKARNHGAVPVSLGATLLRSETAGLVAAALVLAAYD
jgi:16S rRNA (uracil1498-N3)-methyltransferase